MGGGFGGRAPNGSLTRPHTAGLEGGARLASTIAGALLVGAGILHISAAGDHTNLPAMMAGFLVVAALQAGLGWLLMFRRPGRLIVAGGLALTLGALGTWIVSRTAGLPFLPGGHMEPVGFKDGVTVIFEMATLPPLALLASAELDGVRLPSTRLGSQAVTFLGTAMFALFVPALLLEGGGHHSAGEMAGHGHGGGEHADDAHGDDGHHDGEELAQAGGHGHGEGRAKNHAGSHKEDNGHGHAATAEFFTDAHETHSSDGGGHGDGMAGDHRGHDGDGGHHDGGEDHPGGQHDGGDHPRGGDDHHGGGGSDDHGSGHEGDDPPARPSLALEGPEQDQDGKPTRGPALVYYDRGDEGANGAGHHAESCEPTAQQRAAADGIVESVRAELQQYENNPAEALRDGFDYVFGPTDRMIHVVHRRRLADPDVLKTGELESFIYYMTDTGYVPIAGMFIMPEYGMRGPQPGGCLTQWHHHGGLVGRAATAGQRDNTPEMMHVFTYPGLDPWGHYSGRDLAHLWTPGAYVPSVCRSAGDANTGCLP